MELFVVLQDYFMDFLKINSAIGERHIFPKHTNTTRNTVTRSFICFVCFLA